jgi:ABC-type amino acid transport substrate-binding protein
MGSSPRNEEARDDEEELPVKRLSLSLVTCVIAASLTGCASSGGGASAPPTTLDKIKSTKTILLGYRESSVPFSFADQSRAPAGYSVDICQRVVEDLRRDLKLPDLQPKWVPVTVENRQSAVVAGTIDLECGSTTNTLARQEQVDFSLTTFITGASLLALNGASVGSDLGGARIAVIPGTTTDAIIKDAMARGGAAAGQTQLLAVKDHAEGIQAVVNGTADVYATDRAILIGLILSTPDPRRFALLDRYLSYEPYALMLRRGDPDFRLAVNRALARLYRTGQVLEIYRKWFGDWGAPSAVTVVMYAIEGLPE